MRGKRDDASWRVVDRAIFWGSALPTVVGVAFADFLHGVPIVSGASWAGNFFDLVKPYALLGD